MYLGTSSLLIYNVMKLVTLKRKRKTLYLERYKSGKSKMNFLQEILIKRIPVTLLKKIEIETKQKVKLKKKKGCNMQVLGTSESHMSASSLGFKN